MAKNYNIYNIIYYIIYIINIIYFVYLNINVAYCSDVRMFVCSGLYVTL